MVAEQLHNLESLNLCETPVTDDGLSSLVIMSNLRNLNLNSTRLSPTTYEKLRVSCVQGKNTSCFHPQQAAWILKGGALFNQQKPFLSAKTVSRRSSCGSTSFDLVQCLVN